MVDELLANDGLLWSWTIQRFAPKTPFAVGATFVPFGVGYIELPGQLRIESRLTTADPNELHIGMPMRLVLDAGTFDAPALYEFAPQVAVP
jgi:uncharacterized OB-fold protein